MQSVGNPGRFVMVVVALLALVPRSGAADRLNVVATTPDFAALAAAVGGDRVSIRTLAKPTEDPHFVDARPSHLVTLNRADILIESGAGLETAWLTALVDGARNKELLPGGKGRVAGSDGITLLDVPATLDRSQGDVHAAGNPHFLMDPHNARIVAERLTRRFCERAVSDCPTFEANFARFAVRLELAIAQWQSLLAPYQGRSIVTYHNTWRYFVNCFGLRADIFLEPKPGIPPSPPHLAHVIEQMIARQVKVMLVEPFQSRKIAESVAAHAGATVVEVSQFPGNPPGTDGDYIALVQTDVEAIVRALGN